MIGSMAKNDRAYAIIPGRGQTAEEARKREQTQHRVVTICLILANLVLFGLIFYCMVEGIHGYTIAGFLEKCIGL